MNSKISLCIPSLSGGGAEKVIVNLANGLSNCGKNVDLVLLKSGGIFESDLNENVNIIKLNATDTKRSIFLLFKYILKNKPSCIISAMNYVNVIVLVSNMLTLNRTKVIVTEHSTLSSTLKEIAKKNKLISLILSLLVRFTYRFSNKIVTVSNGVKEDLINNFGFKEKNIVTINNPVDISNVHKKSLDDVVHPWFQKNNKTILAVGRLGIEKDFPTLISAFELVKDKIDGSKLVIIGEGKERSALEKLIAKKKLEKDVLLMGFTSNPYKYMKACSVFVLSSSREGFGNVLVEAMVSNARIISSDCKSGPREILDNGLYGNLFDVGDYNTLAIYITDLMGSERVGIDYSNKLESFSLDFIVSKYLNVIESI
ncbi:glycosyltransferase [Vibrio sp. JZG120]